MPTTNRPDWVTLLPAKTQEAGREFITYRGFALVTFGDHDCAVFAIHPDRLDHIDTWGSKDHAKAGVDLRAKGR